MDETEQLRKEIKRLSDSVKKFRAEKIALRRKYETAQKQFHATPMPTYIFQQDKGSFILINMNDSAALISGEKRDNLFGKNIMKVFRHMPEIFPDVIRCAEEKKTIQRELSLAVQNIKGQQHYSITCIPVEPDMVMIHMDNIEQRKTAELTLKNTIQLLGTLIDTLPSPLFYKDSSGIYLGCNRSFSEEILGHPKSRIIGKSAKDFPESIPPGMAEMYREQDIQLLSKAGVHVYESALKCADGKTRDFLFYKTVFRNPDTDEPVIIGIMMDITDRKQLINELRAKNTELEYFSNTISHDLKSPLLTVTGFLKRYLKDSSAGNIERMQYDLDIIFNAAEKMELLIDRLLQLSRAGLPVNPPERISMKELVMEALSAVSEKLENRKITVTVAEDLPDIHGDRIRIFEVLLNLIDNSVKYSGDTLEPLIHIGVRNGEEGSVFFVADNGIGIDPQYHGKVFGMFERFDRSTEGSGLGLSIVKRIIRFHNGRIWIESEGHGSGTTVCFTIP